MEQERPRRTQGVKPRPNPCRRHQRLVARFPGEMLAADEGRTPGCRVESLGGLPSPTEEVAVMHRYAGDPAPDGLSIAGVDVDSPRARMMHEELPVATRDSADDQTRLWRPARWLIP